MKYSSELSPQRIHPLTRNISSTGMEITYVCDVYYLLRTVLRYRPTGFKYNSVVVVCIHSLYCHGHWPALSHSEELSAHALSILIAKLTQLYYSEYTSWRCFSSMHFTSVALRSIGKLTDTPTCMYVYCCSAFHWISTALPQNCCLQLLQ